MPTPESKQCAVCGRVIEWRKKWERNWPEVKYCSAKCRRDRLTAVDTALEASILDLLDRRAGGASICPSEAARAVAGSGEDDAWRALMEPARNAARRLVAKDRIVVMQKGRVVDPSTATGPIRLRKR